MTTSIVVPFRPDGAERDRNWAWLEQRYRTLYPGWELVVGTEDGGAWCKGAAVRDALTKTSADRLVISDADMVLADEVMREGVRQLETHAWVVPHLRAYRLTKAASVELMADRLTFKQLTHDHMELPSRKMYPCGGLFFIRREAYESVGGFDERFKGWGAEDECLGLALTRAYGPPLVLGSVLLHLWHEPQPEMPADRRRPAHADALVKEYERA